LNSSDFNLGWWGRVTGRLHLRLACHLRYGLSGMTQLEKVMGTGIIPSKSEFSIEHLGSLHGFSSFNFVKSRWDDGVKEELR
jgi:hypothetical protein